MVGVHGGRVEEGMVWVGAQGGRGKYLAQWSGRQGERDLSEQHVVFLPSFLIDFACGKTTGKIPDGEYVTVRRYNCH